MSRRSIGVCEVLSVVSCVGYSSGFEVVPRCFLIVDRCGSFLAFCADPRTKTNLASRSFAIYCMVCSLA